MKQSIMLIVLIFVVLNVESATHCVETAAEFKAALESAGSNNEDDVIKLKTGDYVSDANTRFIYSYTENKSLEISGGWFDFNQFGCVGQSQDPMATTLDANDESIVLLFTYNNDYPIFNAKISNLSIINGTSTQNVASGLQMALPNNHNGEVIIDRVYFAGNDSDINGALTITWPETVNIKNSVFQFNKAGEGDGVIQINLRADNKGAYFINNTLLYNSHDLLVADSSTTTGLKINIQSMNIDGYPRAFIANNLFWNNEDNDVFLPAIGTSYFYNNNYQTIEGNASFASNNMSQSPLLSLQLLDFTPQPGSPLIDQGKNAEILLGNPPFPFDEDWNYGPSDFDGFSRVINNSVDIGAVEAPPEVPIFENGFE